MKNKNLPRKARKPRNRCLKDYRFLFVYFVCFVVINSFFICCPNPIVEDLLEVFDRERAFTVTVVNGTGGGEYKHPDIVTITAVAPITGQEFAKWVVDSGGVTLENADSETTTFTMPRNAVRVTATYPYTVTFNANDGTTTTQTKTVTYPATTVGALPTEPTRANYTFFGWNTAANGTGTAFTATTTVTADIEVFAVWWAHNITIDMEIITASSGAWSVNGSDPEGGTATLSAFTMGKYEVTQEQWFAVMRESANNPKPSLFSSNPEAGEVQGKRPVESITWFDAIEFCNILSTKESLSPYYNLTVITRNAAGSITAATVATTTNNGYRLPTEVQRQYAAQSGTSAEVTITDATGWYSANSNSKTHEVGLKTANTFGLYDMLGNVWEWCWDSYQYTGYPYPNNATDPTGASGNFRIRRGWNYSDPSSTTGDNSLIPNSTHRGYNLPDSRGNTLGFRVVRP